MSLTNKVVIVTGASSGIGAATAIIFAREGANVVVTGRNEANLNAVAKKCRKAGKNALAIKADVTKDNEVADIVKKTIAHFGKLDILINNAGIFRFCSILDPNLVETYDTMFSTNMRPVVVLTSAAAPHLVETKGNIVNVSSVLGSMHLAGYSAYCASKAAMNHFSRVAASEFAETGVRVNTVSPGPVQTPLFESSGRDISWDHLKSLTAMNKVAQPEDIGELIAYIASDKASSITGSNYVIDCGSFMKTGF